jgi:TerC family integral membrane protein
LEAFMDTRTLAWIVFNGLVLGALALDLVVFHRRPHAMGIKEALAWVAFWVSLAAGFGGWIYYWKGSDAALQFGTGYLVEESLSVDNMFVFLMIFSYFGVPRAYQHRVLFWGIFGALVMRAVMIFSGVALITRFHWVLYIFGAFLVFSGIKMALQKDKEIHPESNPVLRLVRRFLPISESYEGGGFLARNERGFALTPLFVVLVMIETTDLVFALDSIPAVLAISRDVFIVYTSNVFAILGLRALFFALSGTMELFQYLNYGLAAILVFIGVKMLVDEVFAIPVGIALGVVGCILLISVGASLVARRRGAAVVSREDPV